MGRSTSLAARVAAAAAAALVAAMLMAPPAQAALRCGGEAVTIRGTTGNDVITGTPRADVIFAFGGNDKIHGLFGNDRICGGAGLDKLLGDGGNDRLYGGIDYRPDGSHKRGDILVGGTGIDFINPGLDRRPISGAALPDVVSWRTSPTPITLNMATGVATGLGRDTIVAHAYRPELSDHGDRVSGSRGDDFIQTFRGSDRVRGGAGNDVIFADVPGPGAPPQPGPSSDLVYGQGGQDWIIGNEGVDRLYGGAGSDNINDNGATADRLYPGPGADYVDDVVVGGTREHLAGDLEDILQINNFTFRHTAGTLNLPAHTTHLEGTAGDGYISGFRSFDAVTVYGPRGVVYTARPWTVIGTSADESFGGSTSYPLTFKAGAGDDRFVDGGGDDTYDGGPGTDRIVGSGGGNDTCTAVEVGLDKCETVTP